MVYILSMVGSVLHNVTVVSLHLVVYFLSMVVLYFIMLLW